MNDPAPNNPNNGNPEGQALAQNEARPNPPQAFVVNPPQQQAPPVPRNRAQRAHGSNSANRTASAAPAFLEIATAYPLYADKRRPVNTFIPDASMMYFNLSICDSLMNTTEHFLQNNPAWIPIVSQLYIAVLWFVMILKVYVTSGYAPNLASLYDSLKSLNIEDCLIPGPLVPFFQSLAAINGPFEWIGDIVARMPAFNHLWNIPTYGPSNAYARYIPAPVIMLDQLYRFATFELPEGVNSPYETFTWYSNIFSVAANAVPATCRLGPQLCASLFTTPAQCEYAYNYWNNVLSDNFTRVNSQAGNTPLHDYNQFLGFRSQRGHHQTDWFQHVVTTMQEYCKYFKGSVALKAVSPVGIGACAVFGEPIRSSAIRRWYYPRRSTLTPFTSARVSPLRDIPDDLAVKFYHSDHEVEEQAEQYAILTHTNMKWYTTVQAQPPDAVNPGDIHQGSYWTMPTHRVSPDVRLKTQYFQVIASQYHTLTPN